MTDDLQEVYDAVPASWSEEWQQLGRGRLGVQLQLCCTSRMVLARTVWTPGLFARGPRVPGTITLYVCLRNSGPACLRGRQFRSGEAVFLYPADETDFRTAAPFDVFVLAVEQERFEKQAITILGCPLADLQRKERLAVPNMNAIWHCADVLLSPMTLFPKQASRILTDPVAAQIFETRVIDSVLGAVQGPASYVVQHQRCRLAWHAQEYLHTHIGPELTIHDLCRAVGATERTLYRAFREQFGTTPKAYLKMLRLNGARADLRRPPLNCRVTDIAMRWGFVHFGWFSHDYRAMFGESPSRTLAAARDRAPGGSFRIAGTYRTA